MGVPRKLSFSPVLTLAVAASFCLLTPSSVGQTSASPRSSAQKASKSQNSGRTVRKTRVPVEESSVAPAVIQAEDAMEKRDYARAEKLLTGVVVLDPRDYRAWFDLGFVYNVTDRRPQAIDAYKKSVAVKPTVFEANLNLGLLLAHEGNTSDAAKFLRAATGLKPEAKDANAALSRAWLSLARVLQPSAPEDAIEAFKRASAMNPKDPEPHLGAASLLEGRDQAAAEAEYKRVLELDPKSSDALAGLVNLYTTTKRFDDAKTFLAEYLRLDPTSASAHLMMGRILANSGDSKEALVHYEVGLKSNPEDADLLREMASLYAKNKQFPEAEERYRKLIESSPKDAKLFREFGQVLVKQRKLPEAEHAFLQSLRLDPKSADAYGDLAVVAAANKKYELAIRALDERAKFAPESPGTYFLRATSYDNLKAFKQAAENYHQFLTVADGKFPDQEWQARHRLIAIEPEKNK
jgi:tetratricopeptide (TPR) repeat protein